MPTSEEDFEAFLQRLDRRYEKIDETYVVTLGAGQPPAVLRIASPVVVVQVDVAQAPAGPPELQAKLFRRLLELNASDLLYASYGIEDGRIVLDAALELSTLDLVELQNVLSNIDMAISEHVPLLHDMVKAGQGA